MRKRETFFLTFFLFFFISLVIFFLDKTGVTTNVRGVLEIVTRPLQRATYSISHFPSNLFADQNIEKLREENISLRKKLVDQTLLKNENSALKDQFQTSFPKSANLLPATIIGGPSLLPVVLQPAYFVIDKGEKDGIKAGWAVVFRDNVVGKITKVTLRSAVVALVTDTNTSFTAVTTSQALGVIKGQGDTMILDNVVLSEDVKIADNVMTKGDVDANGLGYPPHLIVGKIVSVDKKASALFQSAQVASLLDFSRLTTVFVIQ